MAAPVLIDDTVLATGNTNASNQITYSITLTAGADFLLVKPAWVDATQQNITGITYNGVALTQIASALIQVDATSVGRGWPSADLWYLVNPLTGSAADLVITFNGGQPTNHFGGYSSWSGVNTSAPVGIPETVTGTVGATTLDISPATSTDDVAVALMVSSADALSNTGVNTGNELWEQADTAFGTNAIAAYLAHSGGSETNIQFAKPGGTRRSIATSVAIKPTSGTTDRRAQIYWTELEIPNEPRRALITFTELETPDAPRRAQVYWTELETPDEPRRGIVTFVEFEVPDFVSGDRRAIVSWVELEIPDEPRRAIIAWSELEVPDEPRRAVISWLELEVPDEPALSFVNYGSAFLFTAANWKSTVAVYFEVYMRATTGTVYARLWDVTTASVVTDSLLSTADVSFDRLRSAVISLEDGHEYIVQVGKEGADAGEVKSGRVVLVN